MGLTLLQVMPQAWGGGMEREVVAIADEAVGRGWRSVIAHWGDADPVASECEYVRLPSGGISRHWPAALGRLVRRLRPDVVHLHDPQAGSLGAIAVRLQGNRRIVYSDHAIPKFRAFKHRAARLVTARIPLVNVAVSEAVAHSMVRDSRIPRARVRVIRVAVEAAPALDPPRGDDRRFVCVANLWPWKGHLVLLQALAILDRAPTVTLTLIGEGVERSRIEDEVARLGLSGRVTLTGFVGDPWALAHGAWGYVHASYHEGLPLAVMEAMVRGLPVIATAAGGTQELVKHERTGLLVPPNDAVALATAIQRLALDPQLRERLSRAGREDQLADRRPDDFLNDIFEVYERVALHGDRRPG